MEFKTRKSLATAERFPEALDDRYSAIRLDFNENTQGLARLNLSDFKHHELTAYPQYGKLLARLSELYGVEPNQIMLSTGSDEALPAIATVFIEPGQDAAVIAKPTFSVIRQGLILADAKLTEASVLPDLKFDVEALERAIATHQPKLVMLATPDNPTGATLPEEVIERWTKQYSNSIFLIDEAYYEYSGATVLPLIKQRENLLVLRTFSKAWGLAGLRVGVTLGNENLIHSLKHIRLPFPISSLAAELVHRACDFQQDIMEMARQTMRRKESIIEMLTFMGFDIINGGGNFYLLRAGANATKIADQLRSRNILVRNLSRGEAGPNNLLWGCLRIAVGSEEENAQLMRALEVFASSTAKR